MKSAQNCSRPSSAAGSSDAKLWPKDRSLAAFWTWFDVEIHSTVVDLVDEEVPAEPEPPSRKGKGGKASGR